MTSLLRRSGGIAVLTCLAAGASGCDILMGTPGELDQVPPMNIPAHRPPRPVTPPELAALLYPEEKPTRDPFLTVSEQARLDGLEVVTAPVPAEPEDTADGGKKLTRRVLVARAPGTESRLERQLAPLREEVSGIILGPRNTFLFRGKLYEEGDVIENTEWVVVSIIETGIRLRTKSGTGSSFLKFKRDSNPIFEFERK